VEEGDFVNWRFYVVCLGLKRVDMVVWWSGMLRGRVEVGWVFRVSEKMKILEV
jgi:hypothetical protein